MAAGFMSLGVLFLALTVDSGRLYMEKRSLQRQVDAAAIEVVARGGDCGDGTALTYASEALIRNGYVIDQASLPVTACGRVGVVSGLRELVSAPSGQQENAVRLTISKKVRASLVAGGIFGGDITLTARAMAVRGGVALAALTLRSTLLNVNITQNSRAKLLSDIFGGLLGGSLNISVGAWNGLIHTHLDLFQYLDQLATNLDLEVGNYDEVLSADATTGDLIQAAIDVLEAQNGTPQSTVNALDAIVALDQILVATNVAPVSLHVGDLLGLQTSTPYAGASAEIQAFQLVQGIVELANRNNAVMADIPMSVGGTTVHLKLKVIEPPQLSAIGDPELARDEAYLPVNDSPNRIYVRSAQLRLLLSVDLSSSLTSLVGTLANTLNTALSPLTTVLNNLLTLNLADPLCLLGCTKVDARILPSPFRFDINIDVGGGSARVTDYDCLGDERRLDVDAETAASTIRLGKMGSSAADAASRVFSSTAVPTVDPVALVDIGTKTCNLLGICGSRVPYAIGGLGLKADVPVARSTSELTYEAPLDENLPELGSEDGPAWQSLSSQNLVDSLSSTLAGPRIEMYGSSGSGLGSLLTGMGATLNAVIALLQQAVSTVLSPILDPLVTLLLNNLGIDLAQTEVGANLSCTGTNGVRLVQ